MIIESTSTTSGSPQLSQHASQEIAMPRRRSKACGSNQPTKQPNKQNEFFVSWSSRNTKTLLVEPLPSMMQCLVKLAQTQNFVFAKHSHTHTHNRPTDRRGPLSVLRISVLGQASSILQEHASWLSSLETSNNNLDESPEFKRSSSKQNLQILYARQKLGHYTLTYHTWH